MKDPKEQACPTFPFMHALKLIKKYGLKNFNEVYAIYSMIYVHDFGIWQEKWEDWREWLDTYRYNSQHPLAIAYRKQNPKMYEIDLNRKPDKNASRAIRRIDSCIKKAKELKSTPSAMPKCLAFSNSYRYIACLDACIPYVLSYVLDLDSVLHEIGSMTSEQMVIYFDISADKLDNIKSPVGFACAFFMFWSANAAYTYGSMTKLTNVFDSRGIDADGYESFKKALIMTSMFNDVMFMPVTRRTLDVFTDWYANPHSTTGMYAVLQEDSSGNYIDTCHSFKKEVLKKELLGDFDEIVREKQERG